MDFIVNCSVIPPCKLITLPIFLKHLVIFLELYQRAQNRQKKMFIARQHAYIPAERDIVLPILSVRPSVKCRYYMQMYGYIVTLFLTF